jgi:hypothetical protein
VLLFRQRRPQKGTCLFLGGLSRVSEKNFKNSRSPILLQPNPLIITKSRFFGYRKPVFPDIFVVRWAVFVRWGVVFEDFLKAPKVQKSSCFFSETKIVSFSTEPELKNRFHSLSAFSRGGDG